MHTRQFTPDCTDTLHTPPPSTPLPPHKPSRSRARGRPILPPTTVLPNSSLYGRLSSLRIVPWCIAQCASMSSTSQRVSRERARRPTPSDLPPAEKHCSTFMRSNSQTGRALTLSLLAVSSLVSPQSLHSMRAVAARRREGNAPDLSDSTGAVLQVPITALRQHGGRARRGACSHFLCALLVPMSSVSPSHPPVRPSDFKLP